MQAARVARQLAQNKRLLQQEQRKNDRLEEKREKEQRKRDKLAKFKSGGLAVAVAAGGSKQEILDLQPGENKDGSRKESVISKDGESNEKKGKLR